ncbi:MAG: histidinol-phosphate transaminase [Longicatena sp.]
MKDIETYQVNNAANTRLNANELPYNISDTIRSEIKLALDDIDFQRYPDETSHELISAYANVMKISEEHILAGNGSDEMLGLMIGYFLGKDKKLLTLQPDFSMYDYYATMHEAIMVKYKTREDGSFDVDEFIEYGREYKADMILFSNPNNPTGQTLSNRTLIKIVEAFPKVPIIIDEAYGEFSEESMICMIDNYHNLYVTRTLSKAFGLASARLGFLLSNTQNIEVLKQYMVPYNISSISQKIGCIVLGHAKEYMNYVVEIKEQRKRMLERLKDLKRIKLYRSHANYIYGRSEDKTALLALLESNDIQIRNYQDDTFRITIGSNAENEMVIKLLLAFDMEENKV